MDGRGSTSSILPAIGSKKKSNITSNTQVFDKREILRSPQHMSMMKTLNDKVFFDTKYKREISQNDEDLIKMKDLLKKKRLEIAGSEEKRSEPKERPRLLVDDDVLMM